MKNAKKRKPITTDYHLLTIAECARIANVTRSTVNEWISDGQLKAVRIPGYRRRRVMRSTLNAFLAERDSPQ